VCSRIRKSTACVTRIAGSRVYAVLDNLISQLIKHTINKQEDDKSCKHQVLSPRNRGMCNYARLWGGGGAGHREADSFKSGENWQQFGNWSFFMKLLKNWERTQMNPINIYLHVLECNAISVACKRLSIQCLIPHAQLVGLNTAHGWIYFCLSLRFYGLCLTWLALTVCGWTLTVQCFPDVHIRLLTKCF